VSGVSIEKEKNRDLKPEKMKDAEFEEKFVLDAPVGQGEMI